MSHNMVKKKFISCGLQLNKYSIQVSVCCPLSTNFRKTWALTHVYSSYQL